MMTRREKLLIRPWQLRRYNNHKKKVINAGPVVDFGPPPQRKHVRVKWKKLQKENERQMKIEEDNFQLLQHLSSIMRKKRIDNYWDKEPPTFLRRVGIYHRTRPTTPCEEVTPEICAPRRSKCQACVPVEEPLVLEERIPWEPPKKILTRRRSRSAVVPVISDFDFPPIKNLREQKKERTGDQLQSPKKASVRNLALPAVSYKRCSKAEEPKGRLVVRQGLIQIALNIPSFADVKYVSGNSEKHLQRNLCQCKSFRENNPKQIEGKRKVV